MRSSRLVDENARRASSQCFRGIFKCPFSCFELLPPPIPHVLQARAPRVARTLLDRVAIIAATLVPGFFLVGNLHVRSNSPVFASVDENTYTPDSPPMMGDQRAVLDERVRQGQKGGASSWDIVASSSNAKLSWPFLAIPSSGLPINERPCQTKAQQCCALADWPSLRIYSWP
jgi:hypothetical protein